MTGDQRWELFRLIQIARCGEEPLNAPMDRSALQVLTMDEFRAMKEADLAAEGKWRRRNWLGTGDSDAMKRPMKTAWRRWFERPTWLAFTVLPLAANGCGTIASINQNEPFPNIVYGGVQKAWGPHTALDVPFSAVADTVVLPYTIPRSIYNNARPDERPKYDVLGDRIWEPGTHGL